VGVDMYKYEVYEKAKRIGKGFRASGQVAPSFKYVNLALDYLLCVDKELYRDLKRDIPDHLWANFFDHFKPFEPERKPSDINFLTVH
jgi:hypothetical protein